MTLHHKAVWQRLETLLKFHQQLVLENKDEKRMAETAARITELRDQLEVLNSTPMSQTVIR